MIIPKYILLHHTVTLPTATFEQINKIGIDRGFGGVSYNYVIDINGKVYQGRSLDAVPAQCKADGMNYKSLGIALIGDFTKEEPKCIQLAALNDLVIQLMAIHNIPKENVLGHCEVKGAQTLCPGSLVNWAISFRKESLREKLIRLIMKLWNHN
jgi:N-acetyl-anhydromuramyl-L-alanine amidase AmpD